MACLEIRNDGFAPVPLEAFTTGVAIGDILIIGDGAYVGGNSLLNIVLCLRFEALLTCVLSRGFDAEALLLPSCSVS